MRRVDCHWLAREGMHFNGDWRNLLYSARGRRSHEWRTLHRETARGKYDSQNTDFTRTNICTIIYTALGARAREAVFESAAERGSLDDKRNNGNPCVRKRVYVSKVFEELTAEFLEARNARIRQKRVTSSTVLPDGVSPCLHALARTFKSADQLSREFRLQQYLMSIILLSVLTWMTFSAIPFVFPLIFRSYFSNFLIRFPVGWTAFLRSALNISPQE